MRRGFFATVRSAESSLPGVPASSRWLLKCNLTDARPIPGGFMLRRRTITSPRTPKQFKSEEDTGNRQRPAIDH
jgi:hypothetical protein